MIDELTLYIISALIPLAFGLFGFGQSDEEKHNSWLRDQARREYDQTSRWRSEDREERRGARDSLTPQFERIGGYSDEEKESILGGVSEDYSGLESIGASFDSARDRSKRHALTSGNRAGYQAGQAEISRQEGRAKGRETSDIKRKSGYTRSEIHRQFADQEFRADLARASGLASLYGIDTNFLAATYGMPNRALEVNPRDAPSGLSQFLQAGAGVAGAWLGGGGS